MRTWLCLTVSGFWGIAEAAKLIQLDAAISSTILPVLDGFVSFSIELSSFPDFAGKQFNLLSRIRCK